LKRVSTGSGEVKDRYPIQPTITIRAMAKSHFFFNENAIRARTSSVVVQT